LQFTSATAEAESAPTELLQLVTLHLYNVKIERALQALTAQARLNLTYSRAIVPLDERVTVDVENGTVFDALRQMLTGRGVELWISAEGRMALVPGQPPAAPARPKKVEGGVIGGRVTQPESKEPVVLATVSVRGTSHAALTGPDGRYSITEVPAGTQWLTVRRLGYSAESVSVVVASGQNVVADLTLKATSVELNPIVATGYGTSSRAELTGAIASVTSAEIASAPILSVNEALQGRAAGVHVVQQSGQPGAGAMVRIRGGNSISAGNNPLYVIDDVPIVASADGANTGNLMTQGQGGLNPIAALNPDDIESIDVLKDASASAIYGARAASGVVLITTKRGHAGHSNSRFGAYYGRKDVRRKLPVLDAAQFAEYVNQAYSNSGQAPPFSPVQLTTLGTGTDWQDAIFRTAPTRNYDLAFSGGNADAKYYMSANLLRDEGIVIGTNLDRGSFRLNFDQTLSERVHVGSRLTASRSQGQILPNGGAGQEVSSVVLNAVMAPPTLPITTEAGEYFSGNNPLTGRPFANPVATALLITNSEQQTRGIGSLYADVDLFSGLVFHTVLGGDYLSSTQDFYSPASTLPGRNFNGQGSRGTLQITNWLNESTLHFTHLYGAANIDLLGGLTLQHSNAAVIAGQSQNFYTDRLGPNGLNSAGTFVSVWTGNPHSSLLSYFSRANLGWRDRYLLTMTGRVDGSSRFGEGNQYAFFPSAALAWRLSEEDFVKQARFVNDLKLRASYGLTGNQDIGSYAALATLGSTAYVFGGQRATGYAPNNLANPNLKWETTSQADLGLDLAVMNSRVALTVDYYHKKTNDLLLNVPVPAISGFTTSIQNIGSVKNTGFELGVSTVNIAGGPRGRLGWTSDLKIAWNRNTVLGLGPDSQIVAPVLVGAGANQNPTVLKVGEPINSFYGWVYDGMQYGQPTYRDLNHDDNITEADRTIIGSAQPRYTGGFTNRVTYGPLGLTMFLQFSVGNKIYNINRSLLTVASGNGMNQLVDVLTAGKDGIPMPRIGNTFDTRPSTLFVEDGSFLRGKNLRMDFTVPSSWLGGRQGRTSNLQVYVSAQNFFTRTRYSGFDPEISEYAGSNIAQGFDFGSYPQARQITYGFTSSF
jgi:TonB-linked SusC/RagA family outer membrane protein